MRAAVSIVTAATLFLPAALGAQTKPPPMAEDAEAPDLTLRMTDPGVTEMSLRSYLQTSHPVMPNIRLTPDETDDILAYLMTLKRGPRQRPALTLPAASPS